MSIDSQYSRLVSFEPGFLSLGLEKGEIALQLLTSLAFDILLERKQLN